MIEELTREEPMTQEPIKLLSKEGFLFIKNKEGNYSVYFELENNNIILKKILDFNLVKLIYDLNSEIFEKINLQKINENEATINILIKHLFEELGLPQRFTYVDIKREVTENKVTFFSQTIKSERPDGIPDNAELMPIENVIINCNVITHHKINFSCNILFQNNKVLLPVIEKIFSLVLFKIFIRVKHFIENVIV
jgi:hypothetical protein